MTVRGIDAFLEILHAAGVRHIFGNPGTTELPLSDALVAQRRFRYILGLQEVPVMGMADGFAMPSGSFAAANARSPRPSAACGSRARRRTIAGSKKSSHPRR